MVVVARPLAKLVAYDLATGGPRWFGPDGGEGYSSPHLLTIDGVKQALLLSAKQAPAASRPQMAHCFGSTRGRVAPASCSRP